MGPREREPTPDELQREVVPDEPLREEDVTTADRLDDRVSEGEGLPDE